MQDNQNQSTPKLLAAIAGFVVLLLLAGFLYRSLAENRTASNLTTLQETQDSGEASDASLTGTGETVSVAAGEGTDAGDGSADSAVTTGDENSASSDASTSGNADAASDLTPAPDFTVYDNAGNQVHLSDFVGKPVILNFWASWCPPCRGEMPDFNEAYLASGEEITFLMVNLTDGSRETTESADAFIAEQGFAFPIYYDSDGEAANTYYIRSIPTTYFIDSEGHLIAQATGAIDAASLDRGIELLTGGDK